jgi:hypothetical protein
MQDCNCEACENGLGSALSRMIQTFGAKQAQNKIASSYGLEMELSDIDQHCESFNICPVNLTELDRDEIEVSHKPIDLNEVTPESWGLSLDRDEEAVRFLQNQLLSMTVIQLEICKSQQQQYATRQTTLPPSSSQFRILSQLLRDLDRYSGISLNSYQQKAVEVAARTQIEYEETQKSLLEDAILKPEDTQ